MSNTQAKKRKQSNKRKNEASKDKPTTQVNDDKLTKDKQKNELVDNKNQLDAQTRFWIMFLTIITFGIFQIYLNDKIEKAKNPKDSVSEETTITEELKVSKKIPFEINELIMHLGGFENIEKIDGSLNSLKVTFKDKTLVNHEKIKSLGAKGTMFSEHTISIIFGDYSLFLKEELEKLQVPEKVTVKA